MVQNVIVKYFFPFLVPYCTKNVGHNLCVYIQGLPPAVSEHSTLPPAVSEHSTSHTPVECRSPHVVLGHSPNHCLSQTLHKLSGAALTQTAGDHPRHLAGTLSFFLFWHVVYALNRCDIRVRLDAMFCHRAGVG